MYPFVAGRIYVVTPGQIPEPGVLHERRSSKLEVETLEIRVKILAGEAVLSPRWNERTENLIVSFPDHRKSWKPRKRSVIPPRTSEPE
jgi:hypothetical protein